MLNSTYFHWAKHGDPENSNLQPDITLIVGNIQNVVKFLAHKCVLSGHSGYFKTLLSSYKGFEVHISNINSHTFACLLTFMYTGQLDLNPLNVYEIFLASNLLHITEALNLCRQYLSDGQPNHGKSIVKPIPRKKAAIPNAFDTIQTLKYQPLRINSEQVSSIFKPVGNIIKSDVRVESPPKLRHSERENEKKPDSSKVILDVACCDGPIQFRKVINKYYDPIKANVTKQQAKSEISIACQGCKHVFKNYHKFKKYVTSGSVLQNSKLSNGSVEAKCKKKNDSNLQCYTCKTCGSKFPSYYFVHKHRKMHHSEAQDSAE